MSLSEVDTLELVDRYYFLVKEYAKVAESLVPIMNEFGKTRKEIESIVLEISRRGEAVEEPEKLKKEVEEKILNVQKTIKS